MCIRDSALPLDYSCAPVCGDGKKVAEEACDNGNAVGCSANCQVDKGYTCSTVDSNGKLICKPICGDSIKVGS